MAADTAPAAVPEPPQNTASTGGTPKGFLAAMMAPVDPARPTLSLDPATTTTGHPADADGALDRSAPGVTSDTFRDTTDKASKGNDPAGTRHKRSIWKEMCLAAATRWAKGGGTANKRLDLKKAKVQANQVKETRTTSYTKSGGLPVRNSGGSGNGTSKGPSKPNGNSPGSGPKNQSGNRSGGASGSSGANGSSGHGGRGQTGGSGGSQSGSGGHGSKDKTSRLPGKGGPGSQSNRSADGTQPGSGSSSGKDGKQKHAPSPAGKGSTKQAPAGAGGTGGPGKAGPSGKNGKDGSSGKTGPNSGTKNSDGKTDLTKSPGPHGTNPSKNASKQQPGTQKTPLQKSRETGHQDGTKTRRVVDHVKAYTDGVRDGWHDEKTRNGKEHARLDKAHTDHKPNPAPGQPAIVTEKEDDGVTTDVKPLTVQNIDANTLTLAAGNVRTTVGRRELRNFKQYERKLEAKETVLQQIADACVQLKKEAENEAKDCQQLTEQAKSVEGGENLKAALAKLADDAKNQATEADELAQQAKRAAEMCKVVLTNIQTRYQPLYKAVVDSDETKPAELRFYNDKGTYAPAA